MKIEDVVVKEGYELMGIVVVEGTFHAIINRHTDFEPYIVCWSYCIEDGTWGQGYYYQKYEDAIKKLGNYIVSVCE